MIARALQKASYEVTQAPDGETAIGLLQTENGSLTPYDVVVTDIVMGDVDGVQVTSIARKQPNAPEVILLTGHGSLETAMSAIQSGVFDYLLKPLRLTQLLERVSAAVEQRATRLRQAGQAEAWARIAEVVSSTQVPPVDQVQPPVSEATNATGPAPQPNRGGRYLKAGALTIDTHRHEIRFYEEQVRVTPTEYVILSCLAEFPGRVFTYLEIARRTHGTNIDETEAHSLLRTHIRNLRRKIERSYISSVRGVGYMLDAHDAPDSGTAES